MIYTLLLFLSYNPIILLILFVYNSSGTKILSLLYEYVHTTPFSPPLHL